MGEITKQNRNLDATKRFDFFPVSEAGLKSSRSFVACCPFHDLWNAL